MNAARGPHPTLESKDKGYLLSALADARAKESEWRAFYAASEFRCDRATKELATLRLWLKANAPDLLSAFDSEDE